MHDLHQNKPRNNESKVTKDISPLDHNNYLYNYKLERVYYKLTMKVIPILLDGYTMTIELPRSVDDHKL